LQIGPVLLDAAVPGRRCGRCNAGRSPQFSKTEWLLRFASNNSIRSLVSQLELAVNVLNDVKLVISKQMGVPSDQLDSDSRLEAIGVESLDVIEIVFALEEKYNIAIPFNANDSAALAFETIGQVADAVQKLVEPKRSV
jgi:acyl carrier protein